jgi:hypothetical protein
MELLQRVIVISAFVAYFSAIIVLGLSKTAVPEPQNPGEQPRTVQNQAHENSVLNPQAAKYISGIVTGIGGVLATFFGAAFGLHQAKPKDNASRPIKIPELTRMQQAAAWMYFSSLLLALILWGIRSFDERMPEAVSSLALTLPGVMVGVVAVGLAFKPEDGNGKDGE